MVVDLNPKLSTETLPKQLPAQEITKQMTPATPSAGLTDKLKLSLPVLPRAMSNADGFGISTTTTLMYGYGVGGNLSKDIYTTANFQGTYDRRNFVSEIPRNVPIEDPLMNRPLVNNMSFSSLSVNTGLNYRVIDSRPSSAIDNTLRPSLNVSASGTMDLQMDRGGGRLNAALSEGNRHGNIRLSAYTGKNISPGSSPTPTKGYSLDGTLQKEIGGGKMLIAQASISKDEMTMPKPTQPEAIDYGNSVIESRMYQGNLIIAGRTGTVSASAMEMKDNQGYTTRMFGLGSQIGATSVKGNLMCRASKEESMKCNSVGVNVAHIW